MGRDRAYYRYQKKKHIQRKLGILRRIYGEEDVSDWTRDQPGRLSKGKIHCSCRMCRAKTYDEPTHSDRQRGINGEQQRRDFLLEPEGEAEDA